MWFFEIFKILKTKRLYKDQFLIFWLFFPPLLGNWLYTQADSWQVYVADSLTTQHWSFALGLEVGTLQELINIWFLPVFFPTWIDWSREPISAWAYDAGTSTRLETDIASITWPANSGTAVLGFKKSNAVVLLTRGGFSDVAHQAVAGIAMAGTATEQLVSSTTTNDYSVLVSYFACVTDYLCILLDKFYLQRFCIFQCRWV